MNTNETFQLTRIYSGFWDKIFPSKNEYVFEFTHKQEKINYNFSKKGFFDKKYANEIYRIIEGNLETNIAKLKTAIIGLIVIEKVLQRENDY